MGAFQARGGAGPRAATMVWEAHAWRSTNEASDFALGIIAIIPPLHCHRGLRGHAHTTGTASIQDQLRVIDAPSQRSVCATKLKFCPHTPNTHGSEEQPDVTRHKTSTLIFDELECRPFTESCRRPSSRFKIARSSTPAMPRKRRIKLIRAQIRCAAFAKLLPCLNKSLVSHKDLKGPKNQKNRHNKVTWPLHASRRCDENYSISKSLSLLSR